MKIIRTTVRRPSLGPPQARQSEVVEEPSQDKVILSSVRENRILSKAKAVSLGALVGLASGGLAMTGPFGMVAGVALSVGSAAVLKVDPGDTVQDSAVTGSLFGIISAGMGSVLGVPGVLAGGLISSIRAAICN